MKGYRINDARFSFLSIFFGIIVVVILMSACTPKKSEEEITLEGWVAELQSEIEALDASEAEDEPDTAETSAARRDRRVRAARLRADLEDAQTELETRRERRGGRERGGRRQTETAAGTPETAPVITQSVTPPAQTTQTPPTAAAVTPPPEPEDPAQAERARVELAAAEAEEAAREATAKIAPQARSEQAGVFDNLPEPQELFPDIPVNQIRRSWPISSYDDWETQLNNIQTDILAQRNAQAYILVLDGDIGVPGRRNEPNFSPHIFTYGLFGNMYSTEKIEIAIVGNGRLYLTSPGALIELYDNHTLVIDGNITLEGLTAGKNGATQNNNSAVIYCHGGPIRIELRNGTITGNYNDADYLGGGGGGINMTYSSNTLVMSGGAITGNTAAHQGGGVLAGGGNFIMSGGVISGNTSRNYGGGVYGGLVMTGGTIKGNTAKRGGGVAFNVPEFAKTGGVIFGNDAQAGNRNTATDGNATGHAVFLHDGIAEFYRDSSLTAGGNLVVDWDRRLPASSGQTLGGWTKR